MDPWQIIGSILAIACALIGVIYYAGQHRDDKQDDRHSRNEKEFSEHVRDDIAAYERLRAVETEVANLKSEVKGLREKWHDLRSEITHTMATWYTDIMDRLKK